MEEKNLTHFKLEREGVKIELRRGMDADAIAAAIARMPMPAYAPAPVAAAPAPAGVAPIAGAADAAPVAGGPTINCPMVGTFYIASGPDEPPLIKVGDPVDEDTTVCIVEAMKVMNEIKAETRGVIKRVLISDASPVQFGEPLFELE